MKKLLWAVVVVGLMVGSASAENWVLMKTFRTQLDNFSPHPENAVSVHPSVAICLQTAKTQIDELARMYRFFSEELRKNGLGPLTYQIDGLSISKHFDGRMAMTIFSCEKE